MNPLEAPIGPGQESRTAAKSSVRLMSQALGQIVAELPHVDRHFVVWRWGVGTDLHIHTAEPSGPIGEQMTCEAFVAGTEPFGSENDLLGTVLENLVVDGDERDGEMFREFLIGEAAFGGLKLASGA